jgi:Mrp family chromosome partitioning ATPase/uncharacterized protein involved in exopolysaccharide biosynthesis
MNTKPALNAPPAPPTISVADIYYIFFRYKWIIGTLAVIGIVGAIVFRLSFPVYYTSSAEMIIKYVVDTQPLTKTGADAMVTPIDSGQALIDSELAMITSLDVATEVARIIGPGKILGPGEGTNLVDAGFMIKTGLIAGRQRGSDVIDINFTHPNRELVQPILDQIILSYEAMHKDVRRPKAGEELRRGIDEAKDRAADSENRLSQERQKADIVSLEDAKSDIAHKIEKAEDDLNELEKSRAQQAYLLTAIREQLPASYFQATNNSPKTTNQPVPIPANIIEKYRKMGVLLTSLRNKEDSLLTWTTPSSPTYKSVDNNITNTEGEMQKLADKYPGLGVAAGTPVAPNPLIAVYENALLKASEMTVQYQVLTNQVARFKVRQLAIETEEGPLLDLQRESDRDRQSWDTFKNRENDAQLNAIIESGNSQISVIEKPTPPVLGDRAKVNKITLGILFGGLGLAFGLPCLIEFVLDQSLKRPADIQSRLGVPYFIGMPRLKTQSKRLLKAENKAPIEKKVPMLTENAGEVPVMETAAPPTASAPESVSGEIAAWDERHALRPFFETLRDRLMTYFEMINLTHKPKLVAVTSCGEGAGVTTTAAGLASALSETGDGNVLLVNMNAPDGEAHHFYRGKLGCALEDAFEKDKRGAACIHDNLYVAKDLPTNENLPRVLPKRFSHLVPKMRASDYDYIIFDMPPMSQISITPRLARYMDMVLVVIESGKTSRDVAKRATNLLLESKTNVGVVLNKSRDYLPRSLQHDL